MDRNFALRRRLYGDKALGRVNLHMIETAAAVGAGVKFCGSGGAVIAICPGGEAQEMQLMSAHPVHVCVYVCQT